MVSIREVALRCGVSTATVSKALNDKADIGPETRARVSRAARELGYVPSGAARALKTRHSRMLGAVLPKESDGREKRAFVIDAVDGILAEASACGYAAVLIRLNADADPQQYAAFCREHNIGGVLLLCEDAGNRLARVLRANQIAAVALRRDGGERFPSGRAHTAAREARETCDAAEIGRCAVKTLIPVMEGREPLTRSRSTAKADAAC